MTCFSRSEFLRLGERFVDDEVQRFPGTYWWSLIFARRAVCGLCNACNLY